MPSQHRSTKFHKPAAHPQIRGSTQTRQSHLVLRTHNSRISHNVSATQRAAAPYNELAPVAQCEFKGLYTVCHESSALTRCHHIAFAMMLHLQKSDDRELVAVICASRAGSRFASRSHLHVQIPEGDDALSDKFDTIPNKASSSMAHSLGSKFFEHSRRRLLLCAYLYVFTRSGPRATAGPRRRTT